MDHEKTVNKTPTQLQWEYEQIMKMLEAETATTKVRRIIMRILWIMFYVSLISIMTLCGKYTSEMAQQTRKNFIFDWESA